MGKRGSAYIFLLMVAFARPAPSMAQTPARPHLSGGFAAIMSEDARRMSSWYKNVMGFETMREGDVSRNSIRFALLKHDESLIEIIQRDDTIAPAKGDDGQREAWRMQGYFKVGFFTDNLDALELELRKHDVIFDHGIVRPDGNPYRTFAVRDPDGNIIQFFGN